MNQIQHVPFDLMQALIDVAKRYRRPITIDWVNRTVQVLSPPYDSETILLSVGPGQYQEVLAYLPSE